MQWFTGTREHGRGLWNTSSDARRNSRDQGATLVEFSLVLPLLLLLMVGIMELGMAFRDVLTTSSAVREGTRVLSALGNDPEADCIALVAAVDTLLMGGSIDKLQRVEIYRADSSGDQVHSDTNTYTFIGDDHTDCENDWLAIETWPSIGRNVIAGGSQPLDIAGMRIIYDHDYVVGMPPLSGGFTIDQATISRLEPEEFA